MFLAKKKKKKKYQMDIYNVFYSNPNFKLANESQVESKVTHKAPRGGEK